MSFALFRGKASWLVAGYNTMSKEEKAKFDKKRITKGAGMVCLVVGIMLLPMAYLGYLVDTNMLPESIMLKYAFIFVAVVLTTVIFASIYMNRKK